MKFGPLEGSSEEIKNFFQDNGLRAADFIALPDPPIKPIWFILPVSVLMLSIAFLVFVSLAKAAATFVFLIGSGAGLWLAVNAQLRFKSPWVTGIIGIGCLLLMLVALGAVTPLEMLNEVKSLKK
ncbi:MAG: hypothetical protein ABUS47_08200 [Steroidobacter sp.]